MLSAMASRGEDRSPTTDVGPGVNDPSAEEELPPISLRRLLAFAAPERWLLASGLLFLLIGSSASLIWPQAIRGLIDTALEATGSSAGRGRIDRIAVMLFVLFLAQSVAVASGHASLGLPWLPASSLHLRWGTKQPRPAKFKGGPE